VINRVKIYRPNMESEGVLNIWILKPNTYSQGNGIHITRKMCQIKEIIKQNSHLRYIIQKYIGK
uniref:tubulin--tyrosine ligase family protein n=1 Tax=Klebsiella pneumoniae TaxID=573 RepID=UPI00117BB1AC